MANWNIQPKKGRVYDTDGRKGKFRIRVTSVNGEWIDGEILKGEATFLSQENRGHGEPVTLRDVLTHLTLVGSSNDR